MQAHLFEDSAAKAVLQIADVAFLVKSSRHADRTGVSHGTGISPGVRGMCFLIVFEMFFYIAFSVPSFTVWAHTPSSGSSSEEDVFVAINSGKVYMSLEWYGNASRVAPESSGSLYINGNHIGTVVNGSNEKRVKNWVVSLNEGDKIKVIATAIPRGESETWAGYSAGGSLTMYAHIDTPYTYGDDVKGILIDLEGVEEV